MLYYLYLFISFIADLVIHRVGSIVGSPLRLIRFLFTFAAIYAVCLIVHIIVMGLIALCVDRHSRVVTMNTLTRKASMATLSLIIKLFRIKVTVNGGENIPADRRFLLVGNHLAPFDPIIGMFLFRKNDLAFVSKKENMAMPFIGRLMLACGCLPLDRENVRAAATTINDAAELIKGDIASVGIYPEGKVNQTGETLLPFRNGAFKIAKKAKCPIVVTTMTNTNRVMKRWPLHSTEVTLDVLTVFSEEKVAELTTAQLGEEAWQLMHENLAKKQ